MVADASRPAARQPAPIGCQPAVTGVAAQAPYASVRDVRITVSSTALVQSILGAIQAYAGLRRPEWLG